MRKIFITSVYLALLSTFIFAQGAKGQDETAGELKNLPQETEDLPGGDFQLDTIQEPVEDAESSEISETDDWNIAEVPKEEFFLGEVVEILEAGQEEIGPGYVEEFQRLNIKVLSGEQKGQVFEIRHAGVKTLDQFFQQVGAGDKVIIIKIYNASGEAEYYINDRYRLNSLLIMFAIFAALAVALGRTKGAASLLGLVFSVLALAFFIVPRILAGDDPVLVTLFGSLLIVGVSLYLAHGFNRRTSVALLSTLVTLGLACGLAFFFVSLTRLLGLGSEESFYLQIGQLSFVNLKGLLLAGIIIGTLGVLDDITTAQTAVVGELQLANSNLSRLELYQRALVVGREHIASLINTLVLAYAGASLPLFILFQANHSAPWWVLVNSEFVSEEIVRTLVGSMSLILAVPIATFLAAYFLTRTK